MFFEQPEWYDEAECRHFPEIFRLAYTYTYQPGRNSTGPGTVLHPVTIKAKKICSQCPVRLICLADALRRRESGVWGGTTEDERKNIIRSKVA